MNQRKIMLIFVHFFQIILLLYYDDRNKVHMLNLKYDDYYCDYNANMCSL